MTLNGVKYIPQTEETKYRCVRDHDPRIGVVQRLESIDTGVIWVMVLVNCFVAGFGLERKAWFQLSDNKYT